MKLWYILNVAGFSSLGSIQVAFKAEHENLKISRCYVKRIIVQKKLVTKKEPFPTKGKL